MNPRFTPPWRVRGGVDQRRVAVHSAAHNPQAPPEPHPAVPTALTVGGLRPSNDSLPRVLTRDEALRLGVTRSAIERCLRTRRWGTVLPHAYLTRDTMLWSARLDAAVAYAGERALFSGAAALADLGLRAVLRPSQVLALAPRTATATKPWLRPHPGAQPDCHSRRGSRVGRAHIRLGPSPTSRWSQAAARTSAPWWPIGAPRPVHHRRPRHRAGRRSSPRQRTPASGPSRRCPTAPGRRPRHAQHGFSGQPDSASAPGWPRAAPHP
jgi:hypothetical protein